MLLLSASMGLTRHLTRIWNRKKRMTESKEKIGKEEKREREQDRTKHVITFTWKLAGLIICLTHAVQGIKRLRFFRSSAVTSNALFMQLINKNKCSQVEVVQHLRKVPVGEEANSVC